MRGEEERRRCALPVQVQRPRRLRVEEQRSPARICLDVDPCVSVRDVGDRRHRGGRLEQRPDSREDGRFAGRRFADEDAHCARLELDVARLAVAVNRDAVEDRHYPRNVFFTKNRRFAGRSPSRRMRYGYHSGPYGVATSTL